MASVRVDRLRKSFGANVAVRDISVEFRDGELTSVLGPSGCGKTTMLNLIAGFLDPDGGSIRFGDRLIADAASGFAVPPDKRDLGMVFQSYAIWPHMSVGENVAYGLKMRNVPRADRDAKVRRSLQQVRLEGMTDRYPHELSGGQQQRVALARAIAYAPQILLFDEPLSNLDAQLREEMRAELKGIHRSIGVTAVYVTHDQAEAMSLSDTIVVMGEGQILQVGSPRALYEEPADVRVARFIGKANIFDAVVVDGRKPAARVRVDGIENTFGCRVSADAAPHTRGALSIRPEGICLKPAGGASRGVPGRIGATLYLGNLLQYHVELGGGRRLEVQQSGADQLGVGDEVVVEIDPERCYFIAGAAGHPES
jgi:ABC-type Fe3+/spermidine/putrescine transport system ATPase subunit